MDSFYLIVVAIAVFLLILCLTGVGILMGYQNANVSFPPSANTCPDGWTVIGTACQPPPKEDNSQSPGDIPGMTNGQQGYKQREGTVDFTDPYWADICTKKKWANKYGINWDGISNYTKC
jgi:hypothetical protein